MGKKILVNIHVLKFSAASIKVFESHKRRLENYEERRQKKRQKYLEVGIFTDLLYISRILVVSSSYSVIIFRKGCFHSINCFPNKPWVLCVCSICLLKTLWEKEKLLVTSNFSFSHCFLPF